MRDDSFHFKQFDICHKGCAMKVGTDGVLLGVLSELPLHMDCLDILDLGTGSGLIALMLAQRCRNARITGIDIDSDAVKQAFENFQSSPWRERLYAECCDVRIWQHYPFDVIVSNPPFFDSAPIMYDTARRTARISDQLSFPELVKSTVRLLKKQGLFQIIVPHSSVEELRMLAWEEGMDLKKQIDIVTKEGKPCKRSILVFQRNIQSAEYKTFFLMKSDGSRSDEYSVATSDFYIK